MLSVKKCRNLSEGGIVPYYSEYFPHAENLELLILFYGICRQNNHRKHTIYNLFYQLVVNMGKYLPKKGRVRKNNSCRRARVIFADVFPFSANISPYLPKADKIYSIYSTLILINM